MNKLRNLITYMIASIIVLSFFGMIFMFVRYQYSDLAKESDEVISSSIEKAGLLIKKKEEITRGNATRNIYYIDQPGNERTEMLIHLLREAGYVDKDGKYYLCKAGENIVIRDYLNGVSIEWRYPDEDCQ